MSQRPWYRRLRASGRRLSEADRYFERGLYYYTRDKLDLALADLDEAILRDPKRAEYHVARGFMLLQSGWADDAEEDFAYGLRLDPTQWLAYYGRGMQAFQNEDYAQAVNQFSRAQRVAPDRPEIYFHRAVAFYEMGNAEQAVLDMEFSLKLFGTNDRRRAQAEQWLTIFRGTTPERPASQS
jgi:tetratricopeptide (TPR) repeat protein